MYYNFRRTFVPYGKVIVTCVLAVFKYFFPLVFLAPTCLQHL